MHGLLQPHKNIIISHANSVKINILSKVCTLPNNTSNTSSNIFVISQKMHLQGVILWNGFCGWAHQKAWREEKCWLSWPEWYCHPLTCLHPGTHSFWGPVSLGHTLAPVLLPLRLPLDVQFLQQYRFKDKNTTFFTQPWESYFIQKCLSILHTSLQNKSFPLKLCHFIY
jgi:hypothetical protein